MIDLEETLTNLHETAREHLGEAAINMKTTYDKGKFHHQYDLGTAVWYFHLKRRKNLSPKLQNPWSGPYVIVQKWGDVLYGIKENKTSRMLVVHHDNLKRYNGEELPTWFQTP